VPVDLDTARSPVFEVSCFAGSADTAVQLVVARAASGEGGYACFANAHVMATATRSPTLKAALQGSWCVFPDGAPVAWIQRRTGGGGARRIAGPDLMLAVLDRGRELGLRHYLFGSTPHVLDALANNLSERQPGIEIVGTRAPSYGREDAEAGLADIRSARPDIVWVALGAPKQELWASRHVSDLPASLLMPVGAAFDFIADAKPRAPEWMQGHGLEWVHRLWTEPRRLGWRYLSTNSIFVLRALRDLSYR
jgi:N-acetylglucosaminyldiphosphoundecaprenol N-acetyl-beta-D-mannosaminyltransferase